MADQTVTDQPAQMLADKLHRARDEANPVGKAGRNTQQNYSYAQAEDVIAEVQRALATVGVIVVPQVIDVELIEAGETRGGTVARIAKVTLDFDVCDTETGYSMTRQWVGTGWDAPGDKAVYKAVTGGTKTFLAQLVGMAIGADPEGDDGSDGTKAAGSRRRRTAKDRPVEPLDKARQASLAALIGGQGLTYKQVDLALGAAGIDALRAASKQALNERLASLTPDQADALEKELKA